MRWGGFTLRPADTRVIHRRSTCALIRRPHPTRRHESDDDFPKGLTTATLDTVIPYQGQTTVFALVLPE